FVWILRRDVLVHLEEISVTLFDRRATETADCVSEIEINAATAGTDSASVVARFFRSARCNVARREISEARVFALEVVIALRLRNLLRTARVALRFRHPNAAVIAQRLRHQRQLRLVIAGLRDACRM